MEPRIAAIIAARLAAPKTHGVVSTYADGATHRHETASLAQAENYATGERRKIGRDLISRNADMTAGPIVRVVSVEIVAL
ncbi:MAG: hypothetical protein EOS07_22115 [Mesorhizobium sp.]|nr:MAG: hypothetical protein EOS07_22115 [Mesorhizobium sp.]